MTTRQRRDDAEPMAATLDTEKQPVMPERDPRKHPEREVMLRSGDSDKADGRFHRVFLIPGTAENVRDDDNLHKRNSPAVLEQAIQQGLHPVSEATLDSAEDHVGIGHDPRYPHVRLTYSVDVTSASARKSAK